VSEPLGLTTEQAEEIVRSIGPNAVPEERRRIATALLGKFTGPVPWMLEAAVVLELVTGKVTEAAIVACLLVFNGVVGVVQEGRAAGALALLRQRLQVEARVRPDGQWTRLPAEDLVPGDVVHVRLGDAVPADLDVESGAVTVDQSVLTGESAPVEVQRPGLLYAGSTVRSGEATGTVVATGSNTSFGRTAELVRGARTASHLQQTIMAVVRSLLVMDGALVVAMVAYAVVSHLPAREVAPFVLILVVASVPVALPATFALATSLGSVELAARGVLVTHLAAVEEAAAMDLLFTDKTGTITANSLTVTSVVPVRGRTVDDVLSAAAAASDAATQDPLDLAVLAAAEASGAGVAHDGDRHVTPFDPSTKRSEAIVGSGDDARRMVKGAPVQVAGLTTGWAGLDDAVSNLASGGRRVLAVAAGPARGPLEPVGLVSFEDPARPDARALVDHLDALGVRVVMVTGDGPATAAAVAATVGIGDRACPAEVSRGNDPSCIDDCDVLAGVLPADKLALVELAQRGGHVTAMTGDGVNDAPALKRAEVGVAVASATDVAKAAASLVLTTDGLGGVVAAIETGRRIYQRMLTYTLNKIVKTFQVALLLGLGLLVTGTFVTTPRLVLLLLFANDLVTMSIATDRVGFAATPDRWKVESLSVAALVLAVPWLVFGFATFYVGRDALHFDLARVQTMIFVMLVLTGQATVYLVRERRRFFRSVPSRWLLGSTALDLVVVATLAWRGILMAAVPLVDLAVLAGAVALAAVLLDGVKVAVFRRLGVRPAPQRAAARSGPSFDLDLAPSAGGRQAPVRRVVDRVRR
jgi:H+-transporting ATPase